MAVLTPRLPPSAAMGGIATAHFNLYSALAAAGWQVKAFAYQDAPDSAFITGARWVCSTALRLLSPSRQSYQLAETLGGALAGLRLRDALAQFRPDIVIAPDKGCPLAFLPKPPGAKVVWISHHNPLRFLGAEFSPPLSALDARLAVAMEQRALKQADLVLCPSRDMREQFRKTYRFDGPVEVVPLLLSGEVDRTGSATPSLRELLRISAQAPLFYLPSGGTTVKGGRFLAPLLAEIGRRHAEAGVFISGSLEPMHANAAASAPNHIRVFRPGALPYAENLARVRECDVALSPALLEGFGMALLEAAWLGVPAAAFAAGGIPDVIGGANGETVPVGEIARLCDAGDTLLRKLRAGELTRSQVAKFTQERFSAGRTVARLEELIRSLPEKSR